jgi:hypothetical protein
MLLLMCNYFHLRRLGYSLLVVARPACNAQGQHTHFAHFETPQDIKHGITLKYLNLIVWVHYSNLSKICCFCYVIIFACADWGTLSPSLHNLPAAPKGSTHTLFRPIFSHITTNTLVPPLNLFGWVTCLVVHHSVVCPFVTNFDLELIWPDPMLSSITCYVFHLPKVLLRHI